MQCNKTHKEMSKDSCVSMNFVSVVVYVVLFAIETHFVSQRNIARGRRLLG